MAVPTMEAWSPIPRDTSPEAYRVQMDAYRRMGGAARLAIAFELTEFTRDLARAGIRQRHPEYTETQIAAAFRRLVLGDELHRRACPSDEILDPITAVTPEDSIVSKLEWAKASGGSTKSSTMSPASWRCSRQGWTGNTSSAGPESSAYSTSGSECPARPRPKARPEPVKRQRGPRGPAAGCTALVPATTWNDWPKAWVAFGSVRSET